MWTTWKNIWNPTLSCNKTERGTPALWPHLHHLTEGGALENGIRRQLLKWAKDGKIDRQTLFLCLVRASPTQLAANIYTQWLHDVSWMLFCFWFCFKIKTKQPSISKDFQLIPNLSKFQSLGQHTRASKWETKVPYESGRWFTGDGNWTWRWKGNQTMVRSSIVRGVGT